MSSAVPLWVALVPSVVAIVALMLAESRDRRRIEHERGMKEAELEAQRILRLRDERIKAYSTLARLTKAIWLDAPGDPLPTLYEAMSEVEIMADDPKLKETAEKLVDTWTTAWQSASEARLGGAGQLGSPFDAPGYRNVEDLLRNLRNAFVELAKTEIGVKARSPEEAGSSTPDAAIPGPEAGAPKP